MPLIVNVFASETVIVKGFEDAFEVKTMLFTSTDGPIETVTMPDWLNVATSDGPFGIVPELQLPSRFQRCEPVSSHVPLPAKAGAANSR